MTDKHVRQQLREAITAMLETIPGLETKIFPARVHPFTKDDLPGIVVKTEDEIVEKGTERHQQPGIQKRFIETGIYVFTRAQVNIEDAIDELAMKVEKKIFEDPSIGKLASETVLRSISPATGGEPDAPTGAHRMSFISLVLTKEGFPEKAL